MTEPIDVVVIQHEAEIRRFAIAMRAQADKIDTLEEALQHIMGWAEAYPLDIFPEPDLKKARELLAAGGMTIDAISASAIRHAISGIGRIARDALEQTGDFTPQK